DHTLFQVFDIAWLECQSFKVGECWLAAEGADLEDRAVAFPQHGVAVRPQKLVGRRANVHESRNGDFGFVRGWNRADNWLVYLECCEICFRKGDLFAQCFLKFGARSLGQDRTCGKTGQQGTKKNLITRYHMSPC